MAFNNTGTVNVNSGTLRVNKDGTDSGVYALASGTTFEANGGTRNFDSGIDVQGTGTLLLSGGTLNINTAFSQAAASDHVLTITGGTLASGSPVTLNGAFNFNGGTLSGGGVWTSASSAVTTIGGSTSLVDKTWDNAGTVTIGGTSALNLGGAGVTATVFNNLAGGVVQYNGSSTFPISFSTTSTNKSFNNAGTLNKNAGSAATQTIDVAFNNTGTVNVNSGTLSASSGFTQTGTIEIASGATFRKSAGFTNTGTLRGAGTIDVGAGNTLTNDGTIQPGGAGSVGTLSISGNLTQGAGGSVAVELAGSTAGQFDVLAVSGSATLGGMLDVGYLSGYTPAVGANHPVLTYASQTGTFATINDAQAQGADYGATAFSLTGMAGGVLWDSGAGDFLWTSPANWSTDALPGASNDVVIGTLASPVTLASGTHSIKSLTSGASLIFSGGILTVTDPSTVNATITVSGGTLNANGGLNANALAVSSGVLAGLGSLVVNGSFVHSGGTISGFGLMDITQASGNLTFGAPLGTQTLRATASAGDINVDAPITATGDVTFVASNLVGVNSAITLGGGAFSATAPTIALDGAVDAGAGTVMLSSTGNVTQSQPITAGVLDLQGTGGNHALTNAGNQVGELRMDTGVVTFAGAGATRIAGAPALASGQEMLVTPSTPTTSEAFGGAIAVEGNVLVVGATGPFRTGAGSAYVYRWNGSAWVFEARLTAASTLNFGWSVAVEGTHIVVGAPESDVAGVFRAGSAYAFEHSGGSWGSGISLPATNRVFESVFGTSMSINDSRLVVGGLGRTSEGGFWTGKIWFYDFVSGAWVERGRATQGDPQANDYFGSTLDISGNRMIVGAFNTNASNPDSPSKAYIFEFNASTRLWTEVQKLTQTGGAVSDRFGESVSISGDVAIVGAPFADPAGKDDAGSLYVFRYNGTNWAQEQVLTSADIAAADRFANSVRVRDGVILASSHGADLPGIVNAGAAYLFSHNGVQWLQDSKVTAATPVASDLFGLAVGLSDRRVFLGATGADIGATVNAGALYTYGPASTLAGALSVTTGGSLTQDGAVSAGGAVSYASGGNIAINAALNAGTATVTLNGAGNTTQAAPITAAGLKLTGTGVFNLDQAGNDVATLAANLSGGSTSLTYRDANALTIGSVLGTNGVSVTGPVTLITGGAITQTAPFTVGGASSFSSGANPITLTNAGNDFAGAVLLNNSGANNVAIADANAITLGSLSVGSGTLTVNAVGITQSGPIIQASGAGAATFDAGAGAIALTGSGNDFTGAVSLSNSGANDVALSDANGIVLGTSSVGTGMLSVNATGANTITQTGPIVQASGAGVASFQTGGGAITLTHVGNDFTGPLDASAGLAAVAITDANSLILLGGGGGTAGDLTYTLNGQLSQSGVLLGTVGNVVINAGIGPVAIDDPGNNFAASSLAVNTTGAATLVNAGAIALATSSIGGAASIIAGGAVTQSGALTVGGSGTIDAGSNPITLSDSGNDFAGVLSLSGSSASITDANALTLGATSLGGGSLSVAAGGAITQNGAIAAAAASFNAGSNAITLTNAGNDFTGTVDLTGGAVSITDANALALGAVNTSSLTLIASSITQNASGVVVSGTSSLSAGSVLLGTATNDFGTVAVTSGGNVALADANAITIGASSVGGTFDISATSVFFTAGLTANNYSFSGGTYTLSAGTYNLGGTTTVAGPATVVASGATINAAGGTINVSGVLDSGTSSVTAGTLNVLGGGTLKGTGTIVGNVNNPAGTVAPGASPGILTINGNYTQGPSGVLAVDVGGTIAGSEYDQLVVNGNVSLDGNLTTTLFGTYAPQPGDSYTFISSTGAISGSFANVSQPPSLQPPVAIPGITSGSLLTVSTLSATVNLPPQIAPSVNEIITQTTQIVPFVDELIQELQQIQSLALEPTTTSGDTTLEKKPPACS